MLTATYNGRTVDVVAVGPRGLFAAPEGGAVVAGILKLLQRWLIQFSTEKGSVPYRPAQGCDFLKAAAMGRLRTENDVLAEFGMSQIDVETNLQQEEVEADPADERFATAVLTAIGLQPGTVALTVAVSSLAGDATQLILALAI